MAVEALPFVRACDLPAGDPQRRWLIRGLWGQRAQGLIGGSPKLGKSWLGLDFAVSVASATACLGHFEVEDPGRSLIYLAEDDAPVVRARLEALCQHRGLDLAQLDVHVITSPVLRLDQELDQQRLTATLDLLKPRLLLLDPLVRIHRLNENRAQDVSGLLGFLTELKRRFEAAVVVVHHTSKKHRSRPGQALRGSSDLHAWGASNAYLTQNRGETFLTIEHRAAPACDPVRVKLVSRADGTRTHLEVVGAAPQVPEDLFCRVLSLLDGADGPMRRGEVRQRLRVSNNRLGEVLVQLEAAGRILRTPAGWTRPTPEPPAAQQPIL